ncbi:MAG: hypothetical protein GY769_03035 [bacterium]|nr:hypothetical protein [bacterium]
MYGGAAWHPGVLVVSAVLAAGAVSASQTGNWTDAQKEEFLLKAQVVDIVELEIGVTGSRRATLRRDSVTHDAHIQTVDIIKRRAKVGPRTELNFRDSYRYNIAAYRLDRLLGLRMVPVSVERVIRGKRAAVTWWVDDVLMMEAERVEKRIQPPNPKAWNHQIYRRQIFTQLVCNADLNAGNILITKDWKIWLIDFTRAFLSRKNPPEPKSMLKIDAPLLARLRQLSREEVAGAMQGCLTKAEIKMLLSRRDRVVEIFEDRIERQGVDAVVYEEHETEP